MGKRDREGNVVHKKHKTNTKFGSTRVKKPTTKFAKKVRDALNVEIKEFFNFTGGIQAAVGGSTICINQIPQGADIGNRIGRHAQAMGVDFSYHYSSPSGAGVAATSYDDALVSLVWDAEPDGGLATFNTVYDTASGSGIPFLCFKDTAQYRERFTVLWEERMCSAQGFASAQNTGNCENQMGRKYVSLANKDLNMEFLTNATAIPAKGALLLCYASFQNTGAVATSGTLYYNCKVTYIDV